MPRFDAFLGPFNTSISPNITSELTMNWIPERNPIPVNGEGTGVTDKNIRCSLVRRPGLKTFVTLPYAPVRGVFPGGNRLFAVGADHFYEIKADGTIIDRSLPGFTGASGIGTAGGTIGNDGKPVLGFFNGNQMMLVSAGYAYVDNGNGPVVCSQSISLNDLVVDPTPVTGPTLTDLQLGGMNTIVLSPSYTFTSSDVGRTLTITSGTGFTPGTYKITALLYGGGGYPTGSAVLNLGAGTAASTGGSCTLGPPTTFVDLQLGGMNTIILSPTYTFTAADVGQTLTISSGAGFTPGTYTITALLLGNAGQPTGNALLNTGAGTAASTGGHGSLGSPAASPGYILTTATGNAFDASDVGRTVQITGGVGFSIGLTQPILSITSNGGAVGASSWGTPGSSLGTGIEQLGNYTFTDLTLGGMPTILASASHQFGQQDLKQTITITSGTGFTPGTYTIVDLLYGQGGFVTGNAILDRAAGSAGATGGHGTMTSNLVTASSGAFMDGYFFAGTNPRTKTVQFSALDIEGGAIGWNPLDTFLKHGYPDNVIALFADHEELYTFGDLESTQVWRDTGNADNPFQPDPGAFMHVGCQAPFSVVRLGNGVAWLGLDVRRGTRRAYHAVGYNPVAVSTPAVEAQWAKYSTVVDAVGFTYSDQGHELWVINFPTANATWIYDSTNGWWHQWGFWNTSSSSWDRIRTWVHCVVALDLPNGLVDKHYGGDYSTGQIYVMSTAYKTDDGNVIMRRRRAPHLTNENMRRFYSRFEIDCDRLSGRRIFWNRLGNGRDRIWQLDSYQPAETAPTTVTLEFSDDSTQSFQTCFSQALDPSMDVELANAYLNWVDATWH